MLDYIRINTNRISYVERAIYKYLKDLFEGIRVLRQRKYLAYSISTFVLALISTSVLIVNGIKPDIIPQDYLEPSCSTSRRPKAAHDGRD